MSENGDSTDGDEHEWRPKRTEDYADGPVLTNRQAETIATLDASDSRASTAALLGIGATTVDDHRQDAQANAVAAIQQLRQLLGSSETIRQAVENELGHVGPPFAESDRSERQFPNLSTEELAERVTPPEISDSSRITLGGGARQRRRAGRWEAAFYDEFGDAEQVEMIDSATGERIDVGSFIERFPANLETETIPVAEFRDGEMLGRFLSDLRWTLSHAEQSYEFRRVE
jgi:hypothetical protein